MHDHFAGGVFITQGRHTGNIATQTAVNGTAIEIVLPARCAGLTAEAEIKDNLETDGKQHA